MTQPPPSLPPDPDELASAIVDGLLPPEEADVARRDPAVARRVDEIRRVRAAVREIPPSPPPAAVDHAVAVALAAFDAAPTPGSNQEQQHLKVVARPTDSPVSRPSAPRRQSSPAAWLAAAAVVLVVAGLVAVGLVGSDSGDGDQASVESTRAEPGADDSGEVQTDAPTAAEEEGSAGQADDSGAAATTAGSVPLLGSVADADELRDRVDANLSAGRTAAADLSVDRDTEASAPPDVAAEEACPGFSLTGDPARGTQSFVADAELEGQFVRVHIYDDESGSRLVATDRSCNDVVDQPYEG